MFHKSYRLKTDIGGDDKVLKVNLKQGIDTIKVLSLEINTEDDYQIPSSEYGVVVGRVLANDSFGVPNVKVSVFVPLSDEDKDSYVISNEYPYNTTQSKNIDGVKYNLLSNDEFVGIDGKHKSVGTFPNKRLVLDNDGEVEVYGKYWKYTTVTNSAGDYMIFGVPTGTCQVHYDCDLSDVGMISQKPYDFIAKGYDASLFKSPIEFSDEKVGNAIQLMSQDKTVFVYPFWGDRNSNEIGITRTDFKIDYKFEPSCVFVGSSITDAGGTYIGTYGMPNGNNGRFRSLTTSSGNIEIIRKTHDGQLEQLKDNVNGIIDGNGVWCYSIPMNLDRIGTDEYGNIIPISDPNKGIPTRASVRFRITLTDASDSSSNEYSVKMLVPCNPKLVYKNGLINVGETDIDWDNFYEFGSKTPETCFRDLYWGKIYTVKQYYPRIQYGSRPTAQTNLSNEKEPNYADYPIGYSLPFSCISSIDSINGFNPFPYNTMYSGAENRNDKLTYNWFRKHLTENSTNGDYPSKGLLFCFENDWVNGCLYFPKMKITPSKDGTFDYFGKKNDLSVDGRYSNVHITGRHNLVYNSDGTYTVKDCTVNRWATNKDSDYLPLIEKTSCFSYINLSVGLLTMKKTHLKDLVFYYRCGGNSYTNDGEKKQYVRLYSTDIVLLGNLNDIYDSLPNVLDGMQPTTALFPPLQPPQTLQESGMNMNGYEAQLAKMFTTGGTNCDNVDIFGNYAKPSGGSELKAESYWTDFSQCQKYEKTTEARNLYDSAYYSAYKEYNSTKTGLVAGKFNQNCQDMCSLFFGYHVSSDADFLTYFPKTFVNTSRICELDVQNDTSFYGKMDGKPYLIPTNGIIDGFDIASNERRSYFASMNYNMNRFVTNPVTKYKTFVPTQLYLTSFDGRLSKYVESRGYSLVDEVCDKSYVRFRYGLPKSGINDVYAPFWYVHDVNPVDSYNVDENVTFGNNSDENVNFRNNSDLLLTDNSFYFYFGLIGGCSAIDAFNSKYYPIANDVTTDDMISIEKTDDVYCDEGTGVAVRKYKISISELLNGPFEYYVYNNNILVDKGVSNSRGFNLGFSKGFIKFQVIDSRNIKAEKSILCLPTPIDIYYEVLGNRRVRFNLINKEYVMSIEKNGGKDNELTITCQLTNDSQIKYKAVFNYNVTKITSEKNVIKVTDEMVVDGHGYVTCEVSHLETTQNGNQTKTTLPCLKKTITISFDS